METPDKRTYVDFAYIVQTMHLVNCLRRIPGKGAAGSVTPTDGSWQGKDGSRLGSLDYVLEQIEGGQSECGEAGGGSVVLKYCTASHPGVGQRTGGRGPRTITSDLPIFWASPQVRAFVQD